MILIYLKQTGLELVLFNFRFDIWSGTQIVFEFWVCWREVNEGLKKIEKDNGKIVFFKPLEPLFMTVWWEVCLYLFI